MSASILLLEIEELQTRMYRVQEEMVMTISRLEEHSKAVCEVVARLDSVTAIVKAVQTVARERNRHEGGGGVTDSDQLKTDSVCDSQCAVVSEDDPLCAQQHFVVEEVISKAENEGSRVADVECLMGKKLKNSSGSSICHLESVEVVVVGEAGDSDDSREKVKESVEQENVELVKSKNNSECLEPVSSTRPSLLRRSRRGSSKTTDGNTATASNPFTPSTSCTASINSQLRFRPSYQSLTSSTNSLVNRIKEICSNHNLTVEGSYSNREGREGCGLVHFYKLEVKGEVIDLMFRGLGQNKREAVRRAFKTMETKLNELLGKECDLTTVNKDETYSLKSSNFADGKSESGLAKLVITDEIEKEEFRCDNITDRKVTKRFELARSLIAKVKKDSYSDKIVNFPVDESPNRFSYGVTSIPKNSSFSSEESFSPPPVFHSRDLVPP